MDIAALSTNMANSRLQNEVSTAVLSKALAQQNMEGSGIVKMIDAAAMELSVNPSVGSRFDMSV